MFVVGIGPGGAEHRTQAALDAIAAATVVVGYTRYLQLIDDLLPGKETISTGMRGEVERCGQALDRAARGATVALVSSGDPGIYGMAGLALEMAEQQELNVPITVIPGVTAGSAAAAALGAPLMCDYAAISLSDLLVPWNAIRTRLEAVAAADLVVALYNPRSKKRRQQLVEAAEILGAHRPADTPVGIVTAAGTDDETVVLTTLESLTDQDVGMRSCVIVGNSRSEVLDGRIVTRRGYRL